jgi:putrescine importer
MLLDYLFIPMINFMLIGIYLNTQFPAIPVWAFTLVALLLVLLFNILGITLVNKVNFAIIALSVLLVVIFMVLAFKYAFGGDTSVSLIEPFTFGEGGIGAVASGAAILALSFLGFDAVSTLAEEAEQPTRDIPRAIFIIVAVAGAFFITVTYVMQVLFPDVSQLADVVGASPEIAKYVGGAAFQAIFVGGYMMAVLGCGITQQMSAARLLYAMGRDGALPKRLFGRVSPSGVPIGNVLLVAAIALTALFVDLDQAASMINFGAFIAFTFVNLSVIFVFFRFLKRRGAGAWLGFVAVPAIGVAINVWLWFSLDTASMIIGGVWITIGLVYLVVKTRGFRAAAPDLTGPINIGMYE